jgi:D-xylose transport system ATP-binding protein
VGSDLFGDPGKQVPGALTTASPPGVIPAPSTPGRDPGEPFLRLVGIRKRFGAVTALRGVDLEARRGEVLALVGDNGAGKSTLVKTIAGVLRADAGEIYVEGQRVTLGTPHAAAALGIATVYQDLALVENLDPVANLFLGAEAARGPLVGVLRRLNEMEMEQRARETLDRIGAMVPNLHRPVAGLSGGQRQAIAVGRALLWGSRLVMLDEPTAALGVRQTGQVLELVRRLAADGQSVILVSHNLSDVFSVADRICVLRLGANAGTFATAETNMQEVVSAITGAIPAEGAA